MRDTNNNDDDDDNDDDVDDDDDDVVDDGTNGATVRDTNNNDYDDDIDGIDDGNEYGYVVDYKWYHLKNLYHNCYLDQKADISTIVDRLTDTSKYGGTHKVI